MSAETAETRKKTRRVKNHILDRYLGFVEQIDQNKPLSDYERKKYDEMTDIFAKNVLPRTQELTGEDGEKLIMPIYGGQSVPGHDSDQKDIPAEQENTSG